MTDDRIPFGRRAYDFVAVRAVGVWGWTISPITGEDGRPSWAKLITWYVVTLYVFTEHLPASVAITAIMAAHGIKALLTWINRFNPSIDMSDRQPTQRVDIHAPPKPRAGERWEG